jgi:alpha-beta hydrolase superfamily lysophospholipase
MLAGLGWPVLMVSLRAHGDSTGDYNDFGFGARHDVAAAIEYLERRRPGRRVVVHGQSLGAAAALFASRELGQRVRGYILESPFSDLRTAVWNRVDDALPAGLDRLAYAGLLAVSPLVVPHLDRISPYEAAGGMPDDTPVLILAGSADRRARPEEARALQERLGRRCTLLVFPGADHLRMAETDPALYRAAVLGFLGGVQPVTEQGGQPAHTLRSRER